MFYILSWPISIETNCSTTRTKRAALLQCCRMASRSAAEQLQRGWLQQSQILAVRGSAMKPFESDKQRFSSGGKDTQKRCQRCQIAANVYKNSKNYGICLNRLSSRVKTTRKSKCNLYFISIHAYTLQKHVTQNKSATVSLCKYLAITVTHLNVRTRINIQTLKIIFSKNKENNIVLHK